MSTREQKLRDMHPGLQELWEQYQVMLKLVDNTLPVEKPSRSTEMLNKLRKKKENKGAINRTSTGDWY